MRLKEKTFKIKIDIVKTYHRKPDDTICYKIKESTIHRYFHDNNTRCQLINAKTGKIEYELINLRKILTAEDNKDTRITKYFKYNFPEYFV